MKDVIYDFVDVGSIEELGTLADLFAGVRKNNTLHIDNAVGKGAVSFFTPEEGISIRKWKLTALQSVVLRKTSTDLKDEKKVILIYFLNPSVFYLKSNKKKVRISSTHNSLFLMSHIPIDFSVLPKQPFYVLDISITSSWIYQHFEDAEDSFKNVLQGLMHQSIQPLLKPCSIEEYKTLRELENSLQGNFDDILFIRSRVYCLISSFFSKLIPCRFLEVIRNTVNYEQIMTAEHLIMQNVKEFPQIKKIAKEVNMSISSLLRQFKLVYKKSVYEYYTHKKMELAKQMILNKSISVKDLATLMGYNHASPFIEKFTKYHGYSPGRIKSFK